MVSIVMPLYNAEKFLDESINSILCQEYKDIEVICINDSSTDNTLSILEKYAETDSRIKIINNQRRLGAGLSRNRGMVEAKGEYMTFLDGDDVFESDMLLEAYKAAKRYDADIVEYRFKVTTSDKIYEKSQVIHSKEYKARFENNYFEIRELEPYEVLKCHSAPWDKIYRRAFIQENKIEFQDLSCCNDVYFVWMSLFLAKRIHFLNNDKVMVHVRKHNTLSRISNNRDPMCGYYADKKLAEELIKRDKFKDVYRQFYYRFYIHMLTTVRKTNNREEARKFYEFLKKEGLENIIELGNEYNSKLDDYILNGFQRFYNKTFESGWYKDENELRDYLSENSDVIRKMFKEWKELKKKVGVWGAGFFGRVFLKYCREQKLDIDVVMDINPQVQGKMIEEVWQVGNPKELCHELQIIIVTSSNLWDEIAEMLSEWKSQAEIVDINMYIGR